MSCISVLYQHFKRHQQYRVLLALSVHPISESWVSAMRELSNGNVFVRGIFGVAHWVKSVKSEGQIGKKTKVCCKMTEEVEQLHSPC